MISLKHGEKISKQFEVRKSKHGKGYLYITNFGLYFESQKHGVAIEFSFNEISRFYIPRSFTGKDKSDTFRIDWIKDGHKYFYEFGIKSSREVYDSYEQAMKAFSQSISEIDALKMQHSDELKAQDQHESEVDAAKRLEQYLKEDQEKALKRAELVNSLIPRGVKRWNDTWFDEETQLYITYNQFFTSAPEYHQTKTQLKWKEKYGDDCVILPVMSWDKTEQLVEMHHGYPATKFAGAKGTIWFIIPTITDKMLTKDMMRDRLWLDRSKPRIDYQTETPRYYIKGFGEIQLISNPDCTFKEEDIRCELRKIEMVEMPDGAIIDAQLTAVEEYYRTIKEKNVEVITAFRYA